MSRSFWTGHSACSARDWLIKVHNWLTTIYSGYKRVVQTLLRSCHQFNSINESV